jgi:hypothetical protein
VAADPSIVERADVARTVLAASEAALVELARALIAGEPADVAPRLFQLTQLPPQISTACERMLHDALSHVWPALWRHDPAPAVGLDGKRGRPWQRHAPVGLTFSTATLQLLRWLVASPAASLPPPPTHRRRFAPAVPRPVSDAVRAQLDAGWPAELTIGDQVMMYLAIHGTLGTLAQVRVSRHPRLRTSPLVWLAFADHLIAPHGVELPAELVTGDPAAVVAAAVPPEAQFAALCTGVGAIVVEAVRPLIGARWALVERAKLNLRHPATMLAIGSAQDVVLARFLAACDRHHRRDLASFVLDAAAESLRFASGPPAGQLDPQASLAMRARARLAAGALLRAVQTWAAWDREHRGVRFLDDDYAHSQELLRRFEAIGGAGAARAQAWLDDLAALAPAATVEPR